MSVCICIHYPMYIVYLSLCSSVCVGNRIVHVSARVFLAVSAGYIHPAGAVRCYTSSQKAGAVFNAC